MVGKQHKEGGAVVGPHLWPAQCSGDAPFLLTANGSAPARSSARQMSTLPLAAALCSAVEPSAAAVAVARAPAPSNAVTFSASP